VGARVSRARTSTRPTPRRLPCAPVPLIGALLSRGALAVIAHVDRAIRWPKMAPWNPSSSSVNEQRARQRDLRRRVLPKQVAVTDIRPHHIHALVARLLHEAPLAGPADHSGRRQPGPQAVPGARRSFGTRWSALSCSMRTLRGRARRIRGRRCRSMWTRWGARGRFRTGRSGQAGISGVNFDVMYVWCNEGKMTSQLYPGDDSAHS